MRALGLCACLSAASLAACGGDDSDSSLHVSWSFEAGDCAEHGVKTVRVSWGPKDGEKETVEFACGDGQGTLGDIGGGGSFSITAEGVDADGVARVESYGQTVTLGASGTGGTPIEIRLHPALADVAVTWSLSGGGTCPSGVVLPYFLTLYKAPAAGGELTDDVASVQESCSSGKATFTKVAPGDYVVEIDSRAVTPALRATAEVTVEPGQDAQVAVQF